jgi:hypothetical protein
MTGLLVLNVAKRLMQTVTLDGSRVDTVVSDLDEAPDGIVVDSQRGRVYWTNTGSRDPGAQNAPSRTSSTGNGSIELVDVDGSNRRTIVPRGAFTTGKHDGRLASRLGMDAPACSTMREAPLRL